MLYYLPEAFNLLEYNDSNKDAVFIKLASGGFVQAEPIDNNEVRILQVNSTDPMDYMQPFYQPGQVLSRNILPNK